MTARLLLAGLLAVATAIAVDAGSVRRGCRPPGFALAERRLLALMLLGLVFGVAIFIPLLGPDLTTELDLAAIHLGDLLFGQLALVTALGLWFLLGFVAPPGEDLRAGVKKGLEQLGLAARRPAAEIGWGIGAGLTAWMVVLLAALFLGLTLASLVGEESLAELEAPSELILWLAGLPVLSRLLLSLTAGVVEELFFRGFLQPRVGIALSTALFVAGHMSYGQPLMLFGVTLLSLLYALLFNWRRSVWAPVVAHALFDAIQLLVIIPLALRAAAEA